MAPAVTDRETYQVGDLAVDVGTQRVVGPGGEIILPKLSFDLLLALIRRAPALVSNDELAAIVWAGVVVSPETVTKRVNLLREALGDDPASPRYIAGLRARGYRIAAEVRAEAAVPPRADAGPGKAEIVHRRARAHAAAVIAVAAAIAAIGGGTWLLQRGDEPAAEADLAPRTASATAVAILPFESLSPSPDDAYLAIGIPEMVQDRLAEIPQLTVIASGSSARVDSRDSDVRALGRRLEARYLVLGSAQRQGDLLRVSARLVDSETGRQLWSTRLDRRLTDLFAIQDEIAAQVSGELQHRIHGISVPDRRPRHEPPIEAQLAYLQGRPLLARYTVRGSEGAAEKFEQAVSLDPQFAAAMAGVFDARMLAAERRHDDLKRALARWRPMLDRALATDSECGPAYVARAIWDSADAARRDSDFKRGLELDPSNGRGLVAYSEFLDQERRYDEATRVLDRAMQVDPLSPRLHFRLAIRDFARNGIQYRESGLKHVLELDPDYQPALQRYAKARWMLHGELAEAAQIMEHAVELDPDNPWSRHTLVAIYLDLGDEAAAREVAGGSESSRKTEQLLLAMYRGDWKAAGEVAYSQAGVEYNVFESWGLPETIRDQAMKTGEYRRAIEFLERRYGLAGDTPVLDIRNFRPATCVAQLLRASGDEARAQALLYRLPAAIDASIPRFGSVLALRTKASVQLLAGEREAALRTLGDSFAASDLMQWWYTLNRDPLWKPLHDDPVFIAIAAQVRGRVARERAVLEDLRRSGRIAIRGNPGPETAP